MNFIEISVTFVNKKEALSLSNFLLNERLVADAQMNKIYSLFNYKNKFYKRKEYLFTYKTKEVLFEQTKKFIQENHSFEVPQIIAKPITMGLDSYLKWIEENTK